MRKTTIDELKLLSAKASTFNEVSLRIDTRLSLSGCSLPPLLGGVHDVFSNNTHAHPMNVAIVDSDREWVWQGELGELCACPIASSPFAPTPTIERKKGNRHKRPPEGAIFAPDGKAYVQHHQREKDRRPRVRFQEEHRRHKRNPGGKTEMS